jgi:GMP synthase (glutamine-hydrolysing)
MGVDDQAEHPWLSDEKKYLHTVFNSDKPVVGICLGAQLVAQVLGATVSVSPQPERGWWPVILTDDAAGSDLAAVMTGGTTVFHSHADTFATPAGAICLASSEACQNQAFLYEQRVLALQFHLEATQDFIDLVAREPAANVDSPWVQSAEQMLADRQQMIVGNRIMANLLESMMSRFAS